jgi:hypothetical protein
LATLPGVVPLDDVPIARRLVVRGEAQHSFERNVPIKSAVVAKDELIEIVLLSRKTPRPFRNSACPDAIVVW